MNGLASELRKQLGKVVVLAREAAEVGARKALEALAVHEADPYKYLDEEQRVLRRALRAQARQLGDEESRTKKGAYGIAHLQDKVAYDQWHRLLFARFLLENSLLFSPEHGVAVTLADCEELAPTLDLRDGWAVAARFAAAELPEIFRDDDPAGRIELAVEDRKQLIQLVTGLPAEMFLADDSLGWVYQFWQAKRKDEVNDSGRKIGSDELAPVTQLFTEDYMVLFLLHNTLGAWWAGKQRVEWKSCQTEEDCRKLVALPGVDWTYLRFVKNDAGEWRPAAGTFDGWPKTARELRVLDPCMGSGHFLVAELPMVMALRRAEEGLTLEEAVLAVLHDNLFGLELDLRCSQIAAFNLALAAWKLAGWQRLPRLNLACSGLAPRTRLETWTQLAGDNPRLREGMERLYQLFKDGPTLGSLINPTMLGADLVTAEFSALQPLVEKALEGEAIRGDETAHEVAVTAQGLVHAAEILTSQFTLVATNVPYLGRGKQDDRLKDYCARFHPDAKADLATCFVERCLGFCVVGGSTALVTPQNWLFLSTYSNLRERLLRSLQWDCIAILDEHAFDSPLAAGAFVVLLSLTKENATEEHRFAGLDASAGMSPEKKAEALKVGELAQVSQGAQLDNPNSRVSLTALGTRHLLSQFVSYYNGIQTGDYPRFGRVFWEASRESEGWQFEQTAVDTVNPYSGRSSLIRWDGDRGDFIGFVRERLDGNIGAWVRGLEAWGRRGVFVSGMRGLACTLYEGVAFDNNGTVLVPNDEALLLPLWCYCSSPEYSRNVRLLNRKISVTDDSFVKVPFDVAYWQRVAVTRCPEGLPKPLSKDPTQWLFDGNPNGADHSLQVATARLVGYRWPRQTGSSFADCPALGLDGLESLAAADGIVCVSAVKGEESGAERLRVLLGAAYAREWSAAKQVNLLAQAGYAGKTLDDWLRNGFFEQHCAIFHHRPFIWQVWDGRKDGFSALVNYHQATRANLEKLTYAYLGDWIRRQQAAVESGEAGSDARLLAARQLQAELQKILEGEPPYDIFVRWKRLDQQPLGWEPDLNDGVRLNIRPFMSAADVGKKGAGVLRFKPNIHWNKDRGTDVPSAPWVKVFHGERINAYHLTLDEKRRARERARK
jgi:hypothetical protein